MFTIGQLATQTNSTASSIRFYEKQGLMPAAKRASNGYRVYDQDDVKRVLSIKLCQQLGFSLNQLTGIINPQVLDHQQVLTSLNDKMTEIDELMIQLKQKKAQLAIVQQLLTDTWREGECVGADEVEKLMQQMLHP